MNRTRNDTNVFFSGIGGSGMSALAQYLAAGGVHVTGSDRDRDRGRNRNTFDTLERSGITLVPQDGEGLNAAFDRVVFSTAVEGENPDARRARQLRLPRITRPELLAEIINAKQSVAVAGTSGKSTTSGWLAWALEQLGRSPGFIGGARVHQLRTPNRLGNMLAGSSNVLVAEACESDKSIVRYRPDVSVILNVSKDHHDVEEALRLFRILSEHTARTVIVNSDDPALRDVGAHNVMTFGTSPATQVRAVGIRLKPLESFLEIEGVPFRLRLPGLHNVYNALAAVAVLRSQGIDLEDIPGPLESFEGVERRFQVHLHEAGRLVLDDYAHNPDKIRALMETMSRISPSVVYVFQPHGYGPTRFMKEGYVQTFLQRLRKDDRLFILPIYDAGGTTTRDISSQDLVDPLEAAHLHVEQITNRNDLLDRMGQADTVAVFGARDESLSELARSIADRLRHSG